MLIVNAYKNGAIRKAISTAKYATRCELGFCPSLVSPYATSFTTIDFMINAIQAYKPGYTAPKVLIEYERIPMSLR